MKPRTCPTSAREKLGVVEAVTLSKEPVEMKIFFPATMSHLAPTNGISPKKLLTPRKCVLEIKGTIIQGISLSSADLMVGEILQSKRCSQTRVSQANWGLQEVMAQEKDVAKVQKCLLYIPLFHC